jgi:hypothetical protein
METMVMERRSPGRPYIGPKAQTHIWQPIWAHVKEEAEARGIPMSDVWREMLEEAWIARGNTLGSAE